MLAELRNGAIKRLNRAVRTREHHAAFHCDKNKCSQRVEIRSGSQGALYLAQAFVHCFDPTLKVVSDQSMGRSVFGIDFKRKPADRASIFALGGHNALAVSGKDSEDPF